MRGSHLGMRTPRMWRRCQRGVRTPSCERRPGDDARFSSGDANSADGGALSTRSSHALVRTAARRRCAVRIWGCELRGWGGVVNAEFARPRANGGQETMRGSHLGMRTPRVGGRCQRGVRTPSCERRPGAMRGSHLGMRTPRVGGALSTRSSHALVRTAARRRCAVRIWGCELRGWGGVVNAEFARPRANGGQETMRGSHLGMRTPRMGGRCQRGVRTPSCERRPGDDARFASGDANSADGGALSTRSSHALVRTAARRRCAVRIWGCELRGWGGVVNAEFARPRANGGQETMRGSHLGMRGSHLGMRTPRMGGGVVNAEFARPRANGGQETMRGSHLGMRGSHLGMRTPRMGGRCQRGVRTPSCERRPGDDARFASGDANSAGGGGVVNAEFARPRANGGQETMRDSHLGMRTPRVGGGVVNAEFARPRANGGRERCIAIDRQGNCW
jgi:hypothetical protein